MTTATIIFEDDGETGLEIKIDFGEGGIKEDSLAHMAAAKAYTDIAKYLKEAENESPK